MDKKFGSLINKLLNINEVIKMKVAELFENLILPPEEELEFKLKAFDWDYDFEPENGKRFLLGAAQLNLLENLIFKLWKKNPSRALEMWNSTCPWAAKSPGSVPSFIESLKLQEETKLREEKQTRIDTVIADAKKNDLYEINEHFTKA